MRKLTPMMAALVAVFQHNNSERIDRTRPTGGHRRHGYKRSPADMDRLLSSAQKRIRKGIKLQRDYDLGIANNPCLRMAE